ncbi:TY-Chap domain-containing protein [Gordonia rhizosphera]|uniref:TY-Chap domain-containing protein n=1 Tax=Gordonia rhizosphera TaxID=83341 RepID=UPI0012F67F74|nr:hypothetical protein [Gordonia rhizosphera]
MSLPRRSVPTISVARTVFGPGPEHQGDTMPFDHFDDDDEPEPWLDFTEDLAARLGDLKTGVFEFIELEVPERGWHGHLLTYTATSSGKVRCVVPNSALSHRNRAEWTTYHDQFVTAGWHYQTRNKQHIRDVGRRAHREVARQSVGFLREWWSVPYPWSLTLRDPNGSVHPLEPPARTAPTIPPANPGPLPARPRRHLTIVPDLPDAD